MSSNKVSFQNKTVIIDAKLSFDQMAMLEYVMSNAALEMATNGDSVSVQEANQVVKLAEAFGLDISPTVDSLNDSQTDLDTES